MIASIETYTTGPAELYTISIKCNIQFYYPYQILRSPRKHLHLKSHCKKYSIPTPNTPTPQGRPEVQLLTESHVALIWETVAVCQSVKPANVVPCYAYNEKQELFDLGDLVGTNYHVPISNST